jgi:protein-S-isoprenylcysteine O-methyltransferase Ste14
MPAVVTTSASTARIRALQAYYCLLLGAVAVCRPVYAETMLGRLAEIAGFVLIALATLGRIWTSLYIAGNKNARVVTSGPYARCRHPLYGLSIIASLGLGLATRSIVLAAVTVALSLVLHVAAALAEERRLAATLGGEYLDYGARVPRFWPRRARVQVPAALTVAPSIYWKAFLDGGTVFALYVALELIGAGREAGLWRSLFSVY